MGETALGVHRRSDGAIHLNPDRGRPWAGPFRPRPRDTRLYAVRLSRMGSISSAARRFLLPRWRRRGCGRHRDPCTVCEAAASELDVCVEQRLDTKPIPNSSAADQGRVRPRGSQRPFRSKPRSGWRAVREAPSSPSSGMPTRLQIRPGAKALALAVGLVCISGILGSFHPAGPSAQAHRAATTTTGACSPAEASPSSPRPVRTGLVPSGPPAHEALTQRRQQGTRVGRTPSSGDGGDQGLASAADPDSPRSGRGARLGPSLAGALSRAGLVESGKMDLPPPLS